MNKRYIYRNIFAKNKTKRCIYKKKKSIPFVRLEETNETSYIIISEIGEKILNIMNMSKLFDSEDYEKVKQILNYMLKVLLYVF